MTFQSTPFMNWIFPDEAYDMNEFGTEQQLKPPSHHVHKSSELLPGGGSDFQTSFYEHERKVALDRVANTIRNKQGMLGHLNTTERSQRYFLPASRSSVQNGVFDGSPMTYLTSAGLRGGRIYTKEGQEWLKQRLEERAQEYSELSSGQPLTRQQPISLSPYDDLDSILSQLIIAFDVGSFSSTVVELVTGLTKSLIRHGASFTPMELTRYAQTVQKLIESVRPLSGRQLGETLGPVFEPREKRLRVVDQLNSKLKVVDAVIREIARTINETPSSRQQVMSILGQRLLGEQVQSFTAEFAGPERMQAVQEVSETSMGPYAPPLRMGVTENRPLLSQDVPIVENLEGNVWEEDVPDLGRGENAVGEVEYAEPQFGSGRRRRNRR